MLDLSSFATKKELQHTTGIDTSDVAAKKYFIALKFEVDKQDINKLTNVLTILNNLKIKLDNLDVGKWETVPVDLKKLSDIVDNEVVKNKDTKGKNKQFTNENSWCKYISWHKSLQHRQNKIWKKNWRYW